MKASTGAALALAVGYVLGRRRKLRTAVMLAGAAASGRAGSMGAAAIKRGMNVAGSSSTLGKLTPQLGGLSSTVRSELLKAGRAAAVAVVSDRIESLSDSLHQRTESLRGIEAGDGESDEDTPDADYDEEDEPEDGYEDETAAEGRYAGDVNGEPADAYDEEEPEYDYEDDDDRQVDDSLDDDVEDEQVDGSRRTRRSRSPVSQAGG